MILKKLIILYVKGSRGSSYLAVLDGLFVSEVLLIVFYPEGMHILRYVFSLSDKLDF
jgi:hypothetical protein